ncbi:hypothetical protein SDC9_196545 [bioreactor metagenome]|uniref:Uncharacterized protein n=1 Tax=bioreactor metagenome TaxID=1076179 RepID=A0A645IDL6_9ZZZZ
MLQLQLVAVLVGNSDKVGAVLFAHAASTPFFADLIVP